MEAAVSGEPQVSFGLDLAGYSTNGSSFAKAIRTPGTVNVVVLQGHCFARKREGKQRLAQVVDQEVEIVQRCLARATLDVDVPIDLQRLPLPPNPVFVWELTKRPVDYALDALPPLAQLLGAYVARFQNIFQAIPGSSLNETLFETYPAAALKQMHLPHEGYKGDAIYTEDVGWQGRPTKKEAEAKKNDKLATILKQLEWTAEPQFNLSHDDFDAALCALTGLATSAERLEGEYGLREEIRRRIEKPDMSPADRQAIRSDPPKGYRIRKTRPMGVRVSRKSVLSQEEFLDEIDRRH